MNISIEMRKLDLENKQRNWALMPSIYYIQPLTIKFNFPLMFRD